MATRPPPPHLPPPSIRTTRAAAAAATLVTNVDMSLPLPGTVINSGAEPSLEEVEKAISSLHNSSPGENGLSVLNTGAAANKCLHSIITSVWRLGKAPPGWKNVLIKLSKGSGDPLDCNQSRGISLINTEGTSLCDGDPEPGPDLPRGPTSRCTVGIPATAWHTRCPIHIPTTHDGACPAV